MTIEFKTANGKVSEKLVNEIRNEILNLSQNNKNISGAEVTLKEEQTIIRAENKICEVRLTIFGGQYRAYARTENFKNSVKEAMKELKRLVMQQAKKQKGDPDEKANTGKV